MENIHTSSHGCRGGFDFTLLFEECFFSIAPSFLLLLILLVRWKQLQPERIRKVSQSWLYWAKLGLGQAFGATQLALLIVWLLPHAPRTRASLPAAALSFATSLGLLLLSHWEHLFSIHPSHILNLALSVSLLLDAVRARSLWLASNTTIEGLYSAGIAIKATWFCLESRSKHALLKHGEVQYGNEDITGLYSRAFFWWTNPYLFLGFKSLFSIDDLPHLDRSLSADLLHKQLNRSWNRASKRSHNALAYCMMYTFNSSIICSFIARLAVIGLSYSQPFLITALKDYVEEAKPDRNKGYGLIGAFGLVFLLKGIFDCLYQHHNYRLITNVRGAVVSLIYQKTLTLRFDEYSESAALTLMSNDIDNIAFGIQNMHEVWASLVETGIALYLLQRQVSWAAAVPAFVSLVAMLSMHLLSSSMPGRQKLWMQAVQQRVAFASNYSNAFAAIKMLNLHLRLGLIMQNPVLTLSIYAAIALHTGRAPLDVAATFTTLSIISLWSTPLSNLVYSGPRVAGALESIQRIQAYLTADTKPDRRTAQPQTATAASKSTAVEGKTETAGYIELFPSPSKLERTHVPTADLVHVSDADLGWTSTLDPILTNVNIRISPSSLTMVAGPVGSGKSTLLKACLGEVPCLRGSIHINVANIAYCGTKTWIRNRSIRDNICDPFPYEEEWYRTILHATALDRDIDALPEKDLHVAIARAVYARTKLAIFDDALSALDATTAAQVFARVFASDGILRRNGVAVILVTHGWNHLAHADHAIFIDKGMIVEQGPPQILQILRDHVMQKEFKDISLQPNNVDLELQKPRSSNPIDPDDVLARHKGDLHDYAYYSRTSGGWSMMLYAGALVVGLFSAQFTSLWAQWWAETNEKTPFGQLARYIGIYTFLAVAAAALWAYCMWLVFCRIVPTSSSRLHEHLVTKVKDAPLYWHTSTDTGVILNRFSQDMTMLDRHPNYLVQCVISVAFICIGAKYMTTFIPVTVFVVYWIQNFYLRSSRQLRHLELEAKSPLYTQFTETLGGLITIRAFGWQGNFEAEHRDLLQTSQRPYYFLFIIQRWLALVLDLLVAALAVMLAVFAVFVPKIGPIGVSLISLITLNEQLAELVNCWTSLDTSIGAVNRIRGFRKNATMAYAPTVSPILRNITLSIPAGSKLGVCGRTGSGKSSLILALLRMIEIQSGDISIDGVSLQSCPRDSIRSKITVMPQEPVLFPGTVRENITTFQTTDDDRIPRALERVQLRQHVAAHGGLDKSIEDLPLSARQKQLLCLARAIVSKQKILLLDEVTSHVDVKTDEAMQRVIREEFRGCTVIAVAHRVHTLVDYDRIAVFDEGRVVEYDAPSVLLGRSGSVFGQLYDQTRSASH
ncbi:P-loop containing nucleoside triphosphate hydrolase protein [Aspergillus brunneoviolaceus CBS 621.78]|uniref:P-loop containing nucleoside triphosphate hydrolase protein n=1 Tax=Aspergillus brunneoviolaceus CBS 621.78 TaxID=1450534 RepID=A0ACD1FVD6_9EURO|nr:P-loop containing nucleoside triphosphate hydrolase protein [Aspergillus brunneoviolaceus CBS 621.78]RAH40919.1 P-loop containing nucleoside triphosphate hydrolase protein [Aspergillus brunneoviolaceus CBS 621.78]